MTHDWDAGVVLDVSYERIASPWDYQIDVLVHGKKGRYILPCVYGLNVGFWEGGGPQCVLDHGR